MSRKKNKKTVKKQSSSHQGKTSQPGNVLWYRLVPVHDTLVFLFIGLTVFLLYSNTLHAPFEFDDFANIRDNNHIRLLNMVLDRKTGSGK